MSADLSDRLAETVPPDEEVRWHATIDRKRYRWALENAGLYAGVAGLVIVPLVLYLVDLALPVAVDPTLYVLAGFGGVVASILAGLVVIHRWAGNVEFAVTDRRLIECGGVFRPTCRSVAWDDVETIEIDRHGTGIDWLVSRRGTYRIAVHAEDPPSRRVLPVPCDVAIDHVSDVQEVYTRIRSIQPDAGTATYDLGDLPRSGMSTAVREALDPDERVVYRSESAGRGTQRRAIPLVGLLVGALATAAAAVGGVVFGNGVPLVSAVLAGVVVGLGAAYFLSRAQSAYQEGIEYVVTDRRAIENDGSRDRVRTVPWEDVEAVKLREEVVHVFDEPPGPLTAAAVGIPVESDPWPLYDRMTTLADVRSTVRRAEA